MTLTIELTPEEAQRVEEAQALGLDVRAMLRALITTLPGKREKTPRRSILDYEGVGKHAALGMDAQEYVHQLRAKWDERP